MNKIFSSVLIFTFILSFSTMASALELSKTEQMDHHKMWTKFKRGLINVVTSPIEIPNQVKAEYAHDAEKTGAKTVSVLGGTVKGIAYMGGRIGTGLWDMITFAQAYPEEYEHVMRPEFAVEPLNKK